MHENAAVNPNKVDAWPTKDFFISMLTKDIELSRSIIDLVDNSVDGARRLRSGGTYEGLFVRIDATPEQFKIVDNCGGMEIALARTYAFRFGRPAKMKPTAHSVGQFGVGMKRALFKLGKKFSIRSEAAHSRFLLNVDVDDWKNRPEWEFQFDDYEEDLSADDRALGTTIIVTSLLPVVKDAFSSDTFQTRLAKEIEEAHTSTMESGLATTLGGVPLKFKRLLLVESNQLKPAYHEMSWGKGRSEVTVKLYAGVSDSKPSEAGWNIFCNGRLVLGADQTEVTGWGEGAGKLIPHFHPQYTRFRGFAFLDSDDASSLPWNTTKTGVDTDSPRYKAVRLEMIKLMRPVIDFLNNLATERKNKEEDDRTLENALKMATAQPLAKIDVRKHFYSPSVRVVKQIPVDLQRISYLKQRDQIERVRKKLKVTTVKQVGEKTFDYFYKRECES